MSDHAFRIYNALKYIDQNLFAQIVLDSISSAGAFSPFHFHRVFTSLLGVSVSEYVRRKRLEEASRRIMHTEQDILDLALECQYESQEAFTRAFKKMYDITPGQLRKVKKSIENERPFTLDDINQLIKGEFVKPEIIHQKAKRFIGLARPYKNHDFKKASGQWGDFLSRLTEIKGRNMNELTGISLASHAQVTMDEKDKYIYVTAVEVLSEDQCPAGLIEINIPATAYAKFSHKGHVADASSTHRQIWNNWIPEARLKVTEAPQIEIYGAKFKLDSSESVFDILVPVHN